MAASQPQTPADDSLGRTLISLREHYRPLLVFAPNGSDTRLLKQVQLLTTNSSELRERQVILVPLIESGDWGGWAKDMDHGLIAPLRGEDPAALRRRFHVPGVDFTVILIGKDGGEKLRSLSPVTIGRLTALIDAMPMRQQEVQDGHTK